MRPAISPSIAFALLAFSVSAGALESLPAQLSPQADEATSSDAGEPNRGDTVPKELPGLHNVHKATSRVYLGSEPHGEEAFEQLKKLGVRVIVSVDGAQPDLATAKKFEIRYVHIPIGYDAIPKDAALALTRVGREINAPIYVHCHHGKHRGPAAAAILCLSNQSITLDDALALMKSAGTGKDYVGLWRDVREFQPPRSDVSLPELVESAKVDSVAAAMAKLDRSFDQVKLFAKSGWKVPADHPDLNPRAEARLVQEGLHESRRHCSPEASDEFRKWLEESDVLAEELCKAIGDANDTRAAAALKALEAKCVQCHVQYRN